MKKAKEPKEMREPESRAAQFAAFDALKGYSEMIAEAERENDLAFSDRAGRKYPEKKQTGS